MRRLPANQLRPQKRPAWLVPYEARPDSNHPYLVLPNPTQDSILTTQDSTRRHAGFESRLSGLRLKTQDSRLTTTIKPSGRSFDDARWRFRQLIGLGLATLGKLRCADGCDKGFGRGRRTLTRHDLGDDRKTGPHCGESRNQHPIPPESPGWREVQGCNRHRYKPETGEQRRYAFNHGPGLLPPDGISGFGGCGQLARQSL